ncbi:MULTISPECIES: hypothetical protein [unclassified Candidatus Tisiphia]|uniref:hypothetical protein n=1 Tax=unclassified Candidatus Tisiphia TaxID=2996318 RepID=UPI00312CA38C
MADKAYDTNTIIEFAEQANIIPVIPSKRNRKIQREIDKDLYKLRHIIGAPRSVNKLAVARAAIEVLT